ncbi:MAG TPA: benzoate-CoA ligase family protein [Caulobacteraceae bacterium]|jgi:benzoate-CoA ligase|nr:benzoate-CoA ligase family protein [Caulobacteraceae bacterium]
MAFESRGGGYNAAVDLLGRNLPARADKVAFIDAQGRHTFQDVAEKSGRTGAALLGLGLSPGDRVALLLQDGIDFIACFLGAIRVGLVPVPLNTLAPAQDYAFLLTDSGARAVVVSEPLASTLDAGIALSSWKGSRVVAAGPGGGLAKLLANAPVDVEPVPSSADDIAFWLYSSGSTGLPKGAPHRHGSLAATAELFSRQIFGLRPDDVVFSAAKLFFAYGLGNSLTFPLYAGATCVLFPDRVTPDAVVEQLAAHGVTVFCGVPTLYAALVASRRAASLSASSMRLCMSAGEALPAGIARAWTAATGVEIIDGIGSTEMLHIFVSNRPGQVRYGTTGLPVPGYEVRLLAEDGSDVAAGGLGELHVRGPSMTAGYWNRPEKTSATFVDGWMRTGDKFEMDAEGFLIHRGRADDMLKVSGIWVSPVEVEAELLTHDAVAEAAVIGVEDAEGLTKTKAFVVLKPGVTGTSELADNLKDFIKSRLAPHKYPRSIVFVDTLPKTTTGKIRRHVLRDQEIGSSAPAGPIV